MNKNFKVVFSKARGALMVVNELTSSVQAKGTKTVIATAVASLVAGGAVAAETQWVDAPDALEAVTATQTWDKIVADGNNAFVHTATTGDKNVPLSFVSVTDEKTFNGTLWVTGTGAKAQATGFGVSGDKGKFTNAGTIYVTSGEGGVNYQNDAVWAGNGATAVNTGKIVAKDAYGMKVGSGEKASHLINKGEIVVESTGAGIELGAAAGSDAVNEGSIVVGAVNKQSDQKLDFGHGVLIQDTTGVKFTNKGTIVAGKDASAIEVKNNGTTGEIVLGATSKIVGDINIGANTTVELVVDGAKDKLAVKSAGTTDLVVKNGADVELVDGKASSYANIDVLNGKLSASIWQADNRFVKLTVAKDGVFNITKLNSGGTADQTAAGAKPHNQLLIAFGSNYTLEGGKLQVAGADYQGDVQVGASHKGDKGTGTLTIRSGDYTFNNLKVGNAAGNAVTVEGGSLTVLGKLDAKSSKGGAVHLNGGTTTLKGDLLTHQTGDFQLNGGKLVTTAKNVFEKTPAAQAAATAEPTWKVTDAWSNVKTEGGVLELVETGFEYSLADLKAAEKLVNGSETIKTQLLLNGTLKLAEGEKLDGTSVAGKLLADQTAVADENGAFAVNSNLNTVIGAVDFGGKAGEDKKVTIATTGNGSLVLEGNGGNVFAGMAGAEVVEATGKLVLGQTTESNGVVNVKTLQADTLTVVGDFAAQNVVVKTAGTVTGALTVDTLKTTDADGIDVAGALVVNGAVKEGKPLADITGNVNVQGEGAVLTTNREGFTAAAAKLEKTDLDKSIIYVDRTLNLDGSAVKVGVKEADQGQATQSVMFFAAPANTTPTPASTVTIGADGLAVVDATAFLGQKNAVFGEADVKAEAGEILLVNVNKLGDVKLGKSVTVGDNPNVDTDSLYVLVDKDSKFADGVASLVYAKGLHSDKTVDARLEGLFKQGASAKEMAVLNTLENEVYVAVDEKTGKEHFNALGEAALEQATGGNATAGVFNVAYDANAQVTDAITRHQLAAHDGMGVWADVFYAKNEAKEVYGNHGYSADIYGGVLGFDATFSCGATAGLALAVGSADADSEGGVFANKLESDFWGLSVYTAQDFGGLNVKADLGYMDFSNDFKGLGDASDATTLTFGVRGDYTVFQSGALSVTPHAGLRYTRIDTDAVAFNDEQKMNVFELPVGVKFAGMFETNGWKVVPSYDFTVVPQVGDKEVKVFGKAGDMTVLTKGLFNNVIGVEATNGNLTFGLNAVYGAGSDDRSNTQINANVRYNF